MVLELKLSSDFRDSLSRYSDEQLDAMEIPVEIPWEPGIVSRVETHPNVQFVVFVPTIRTMAYAAERLSQNLKFDITTLEGGRLSFSGKSDKKWKDFTKGLGTLASRGLILRLVTKAISHGARVDPMVEVMDCVLFSGLRPQDADVLARVQNLRLKR